MPRREGTWLFIWRLIYPLLIFIGVELIIEMAAGVFFSVSYIAENGVEALHNEEAVNNALSEFINKNLMFITIIRSLLVIPFGILFMKLDARKDRIYQRNKEYTSYKKIWLAALPFFGAASALAFNHLIPVVLTMFQEMLNAIIKIIIHKDGGIDLFATFNELSGNIYSSSLVLIVISTVILAPVVEELIFRGLLYKRLRNRLGVVLSTVISAFVFGLVHGNVVQFFYAFALGVFMALVYEQFKTIWASIIFHAGANLISVVITEVLPEDGLNISTAGFVMLMAVELAVTFGMLFLIRKKVDRREIQNQITEEV